MELICADNALRLKQIETLYLQSFPKNERKPFQLICQKRNEGFSDILSIEENGEFLGLAITIRHEDKVLLDYFAMDPQKQGKGYGTAALSSLLVFYEGKRMILEIETTTQEAANLPQRLRRKNFYIKNGMTPLGFMVDLFGVPMEVLSNGTRLTFDEYLDLYVKTYGEKILKFVKLVR